MDGETNVTTKAGDTSQATTVSDLDFITPAMMKQEIVDDDACGIQLENFNETAINYNIIKTEQTANQPLRNCSVLAQGVANTQYSYIVSLKGGILSIVVPAKLGLGNIKLGNVNNNQLIACSVCGDQKPQGTSYGVICCEGCKGFFKRIIQGEQKVPSNLSECPNEGNCVIDKYSRTKCRYCRLKACLMAGMNANLVLHPKYRIKQSNIMENHENNRQNTNNNIKEKGIKRSHDKISKATHENKNENAPNARLEERRVDEAVCKGTAVGLELRQMMQFEKKGPAILASTLVGIENVEYIVTSRNSIWAVEGVTQFTNLLADSEKYPFPCGDSLILKKKNDIMAVRNIAHMLLEQTIDSMFTLPLFQMLRTKVKVDCILRTWSKMLILTIIEYDCNLTLNHVMMSAFTEAEIQRSHHWWLCNSFQNFAKDIGEAGQVLSSAIAIIKFLKPSKVELLLLKLLVIFSAGPFLKYGIDKASEIEKMREVLLGYLCKTSPMRGLSLMNGLTHLMLVTDKVVVRIFYPARTCIDMEDNIYQYCKKVFRHGSSV